MYGVIVISIIDNGGLEGAAIDNEGNLHTPGTVSDDSYTITYKLCEIADSTNCTTAEVIVVVSAVAGREDFDTIKLTIYLNPSVYLKYL